MAKKIRDVEDIEDINRHTTNYSYNTNCLSNEEYCEYIDKVDKEPINYNGCLTFMEIAKKYNDLYVAFMKDYEALPIKLDLGREIDITRFQEGNYIDGFGRSAVLFVYENSIIEGNNCSAEFRIVEGKDGIRCSINNHFNHTIYDKGYFYKRLDIDPEILKSYLDLFSKHHEFIKLFTNNETVSLSDRTWVITRLYKDNYLNITDGLEKLEIYGYLSDTNNFIFEIYFKMGENFGIDFSKTTFYINDRKTKFTEEDITDFVNSIYVNKFYVLVNTNREELYNRFDICDPNTVYKICEFTERLNERFGKEFKNYEVIEILEAAIKSSRIILRSRGGRKPRLEDKIVRLFERESYDDIILKYQCSKSEFEVPTEKYEKGTSRQRKR